MYVMIVLHAFYLSISDIFTKKSNKKKLLLSESRETEPLH